MLSTSAMGLYVAMLGDYDSQAWIGLEDSVQLI